MKHWIFTIFLLPGALGYSQNDATLKKQAKEYFAYQRYEDALKTLQKSRNLSRHDEEGRFLIALCQYQLNRLDEAADLLQNLVANEKTLYPECWYYLGRIYHARHQFVEAGKFYKAYLKNIAPNDPNRPFVTDLIRRCANGQQYQFKPTEAYVENLGSAVNTPYDEFAPVLSPNREDRIYFSAARPESMGGKRDRQGAPDERFGRYFSDMFFCENVKGTWGNVQSMPYQLNSPQHEVLLGLNRDGSALLYFRGLSLEQGEVLVDTFRQSENRVLSSDPFLTPMDTRNGDRSPFLFQDTLLFFASARPGGYGGLDLYKTSWRNGRWTTPQNLGPEINTPYDETSPFIALDGKTLYFSSNFPERSIGGLDVFRSVYIASANLWTTPQNLGMPINSAGDEDHFRLARDGFTGFFDSSRKDGFGQRDLYIAYFNNYLTEMEPAAAMTAYDKQPTPAAPTPPTPASAPTLAPQKDIPPPTAPVTTAPSPNNTSTLFFNRESDLEQPDRIAKLRQVSGQLLASPDRRLVLTAYALDPEAGTTGMARAMRGAEQAAAWLNRQGVAAGAIFMRATIAPKKPANAESAYSLIIEINGEETLAVKGTTATAVPAGILHEELFYKIQIASSKTSDYSHPLLSAYPPAMVEKTLDFDFYRYTVGATRTFAEAQQLQQEIRTKGIGSAYVAAYVRGRRIETKEARNLINDFPDLRRFAGK